MIDLNIILNTLKENLSIYTDIFHITEQIENVSIDNITKEATLTTTDINEVNINLDSAIIKNIKYKFAIRNLKILDTINGNTQLLLLLNEPLNLEIGSKITIKNITTDISYNNEYHIVNNNNNIEFIISINDISYNINEIQNEGDILLQIYNNAMVKNSLNGYYKIYITQDDINQKLIIKYKIDDNSNKKEYNYNNIDFSEAYIGFAPRMEIDNNIESYITNILPKDFNNQKYQLLLYHINDSGTAINGISNSNRDQFGISTDPFIDRRTLQCNIVIFSNKLEMVDDTYLIQQRQFFEYLTILSFCIRKALTYLLIDLSRYVDNTNNKYHTFPPRIGDIGRVEKYADRLYVEIPIYISYDVRPEYFRNYNLSTTIKNIDINNNDFNILIN